MSKVLAHYDSNDSLEVAMQAFGDSMFGTYIEAGIVGSAMLAAAALIYVHRIVGWYLWLVCLTASMSAVVFAISFSGASVGVITRLLLLVGLAYASFRAYQGAAWKNWFKPSRLG